MCGHSVLQPHCNVVPSRVPFRAQAAKAAAMERRRALHIVVLPPQLSSLDDADRTQLEAIRRRLCADVLTVCSDMEGHTQGAAEVAQPPAVLGNGADGADALAQQAELVAAEGAPETAAVADGTASGHYHLREDLAVRVSQRCYR
jgi:hypothetical protein